MSNTALSTTLVVENGNFTIANEMYSKNPEQDLCINTPDRKYSIIPVDIGKALIIPEVTSVFESSALIQETPDEFIFAPHDIFENIDCSFSARLKKLLSDDSNSSKVEYRIEKDSVQNLLKQNGFLQFEDLMTAITGILEKYPTVTTKNKKIRKTTPDDVIEIFTVLLKNGISFELAYSKMIALEDEFFNTIVMTKNKYSFFVEYVMND